jgi:hypothetical protein
MRLRMRLRMQLRMGLSAQLASELWLLCSPRADSAAHASGWRVELRGGRPSVHIGTGPAWAMAPSAKSMQAGRCT